ncbi:MAG: hypothetical protein KGJ59_06860 [Bacteroidota bacterium]|nr:hypothetical protein [Bacteroidota bacterium]
MFIATKVYRPAAITSLLLLMVISAQLQAQMNRYIRSVTTPPAQEGAELQISAGLNNTSDIARVLLYYRAFGTTEFKILEMPINRDSADVTIPPEEVAPPFIECYVLVETNSGKQETYPYENPQTIPMRIPIEPRSPKDQEVIILSPDRDDNLLASDIYISVSLVYATDNIDRSRTQVFFDNVNVSSREVVMGDLVVVSASALPANIGAGLHTITVKVFDKAGALYHTRTRPFNVLTKEEAEEISTRPVYSADAQVELRQENIKSIVTNYNRLDMRGNASYGILKSAANLHLTSEEKPDRQPQNRYLLSLDAQYARASIGDAYPRLPSTIMDGRRVRGFTFDLLLGAFNMNYATGEIMRRTALDDSTHRLLSFRRTLSVVRPSFGKGENFQLGFTYLHAIDQYGTGDSTNTTLMPQENVVFGSDALVAFDNHHIELTGQGAFSLNNTNIAAPEFTDARIDSATGITGSNKKQLKLFLPYVSKIITFNENLQPLNPSGLTSLVYETALALNYFGNYLKGTYLYHGRDYNSSGTTALRNDVRGYNIFDRLRLLENKLFLTASFEQLQNNTANTEIATTTYGNMLASVSYYPASNLPNVTVGYGINKNHNPVIYDSTLAGYDPSTAARAIDDKTNRYFIQSTYDFTSPQGRHNVTLSIDNADKNDLTPNNQDVKSFNGFFLVNTVHTFPLESTLGYAVSTNSIPQVQIVLDSSSGVVVPKTVTTFTSLNYQTITLSGRYRLISDILRISATFAPTFGDFKRTLYDVNLQWTIARNQNAVFEYQFIVNSPAAGQTLASNNDSFASLLYRVNF